MRFTMPNLATRDDSSLIQFRMRVPSDVLFKARGRLVFIELPAIGTDDAITVAAKVGDCLKFSLRTRDPVAAKARHGAALSCANKLFAGIRNGPRPLTLRQIVALSGDVFRLFLDEVGDDPGSADNWQAVKAFNRAVKEGRVVTPPTLQPDPKRADEIAIARQVFGVDLTAGVDGHESGTPAVTALEARFGLLANWTLLRQGVEVGPDDRVRLLYAVEKASTDAARVLVRHARMDFSPATEIEARFPTFEAPKPTAPALTMTDMLERWRAEAAPAPKTLVNWRAVLKRFRAFVGHDDAGRITPETVIAFKDHLLAEGVALRTVGRVHLIALHRLFGFAVDNRLLTVNPVSKIKVSVKVRAGEGKLGYTSADIARLVTLAAGEAKPERRYGTLLLATTGARAGEIFQLWAEQVVGRDGVPCIEIRPAPDGGRLKNAGAERIVPLHPAVVASGFVEWAKAKATGPLFYKAVAVEADAIHPSNNATKRVGEWAKAAGFGDARVAPLHGMRHWVKSTLHAEGVNDSTANAIQGHSDGTEAATYRHISIATLAAAVAKLPVPTIRPVE